MHIPSNFHLFKSCSVPYCMLLEFSYLVYEAQQLYLHVHQYNNDLNDVFLFKQAGTYLNAEALILFSVL